MLVLFSAKFVVLVTLQYFELPALTKRKNKVLLGFRNGLHELPFVLCHSKYYQLHKTLVNLLMRHFLKCILLNPFRIEINNKNSFNGFNKNNLDNFTLKVNFELA
jgi:hypothetical protein